MLFFGAGGGEGDRSQMGKNSYKNFCSLYLPSI